MSAPGEYQVAAKSQSINNSTPQQVEMTFIALPILGSPTKPSHNLANKRRDRELENTSKINRIKMIRVGVGLLSQVQG